MSNISMSSVVSRGFCNVQCDSFVSACLPMGISRAHKSRAHLPPFCKSSTMHFIISLVFCSASKASPRLHILFLLPQKASLLLPKASMMGAPSMRLPLVSLLLSPFSLLLSSIDTRHR